MTLHGCEACLEGRPRECTGKCRQPECKRMCELSACCDERNHTTFCECINHQRSPMHPRGIY